MDGASSVDGSSVVIFQKAVDDATVHRLPHCVRLWTASMPLSYPPMTTKSSPGSSFQLRTLELWRHSSAPGNSGASFRGYWNSPAAQTT